MEYPFHNLMPEPVLIGPHQSTPGLVTSSKARHRAIPQDLLRERYGLTTDGICRSVKELVTKSPITSPEQEFFSAAVDHLPHGDEQGS